MEHIDRYEQAMEPARRRFDEDAAVRAICEPGIGAEHLERFFLYWSALGVGVTEPVEGWIRRAGQACARLGEAGVAELGVALEKHAKAEADHHLLFISDVRFLAKRATDAGRDVPDPDELLTLPLPEAAYPYRDLHESVIAGPEPYAQIAIENEMERQSLTFGPAVVANARAVLGDDVVGGLSFLDEHIELDVGHTKFNRRQMARFLDRYPHAMDALVAAGSAALDTYRVFLSYCVEISRPVPAEA